MDADDRGDCHPGGPGGLVFEKQIDSFMEPRDLSVHDVVTVQDQIADMGPLPGGGKT